MQKLSIHLTLVLKTPHWYRFHPCYLSNSPVLCHKCQRVFSSNCTSAWHAGRFDCVMTSLILITVENQWTPVPLGNLFTKRNTWPSRHQKRIFFFESCTPTIPFVKPKWWLHIRGGVKRNYRICTAFKNISTCHYWLVTPPVPTTCVTECTCLLKHENIAPSQ